MGPALLFCTLIPFGGGPKSHQPCREIVHFCVVSREGL